MSKGTTLNVGKVALQTTKSETILNGGTGQYIISQNWPSDWIVKADLLASQ